MYWFIEAHLFLLIDTMGAVPYKKMYPLRIFIHIYIVFLYTCFGFFTCVALLFIYIYILYHIHICIYLYIYFSILVLISFCIHTYWCILIDSYVFFADCEIWGLVSPANQRNGCSVIYTHVSYIYICVYVYFYIYVLIYSYTC